MANIRLDISYPIVDGSPITFYAPCDFKDVEKLVIYYPDNGVIASHTFTFKDAQGNDLTDFNDLFAKDACVKVILSVSQSSAFIQNAPTSGVHTFIGSNPELLNTKKGGLRINKIFGSSIYDVTKGYQLFNHARLANPSYSNGGCTLTNNLDGSFTVSGETLTANCTRAFEYPNSDCKKLFKAGTYRLKLNGEQTYPYFYVAFHTGPLARVAELKEDGEEFTITDELLNSSSFTVRFGFSSSVSTSNIIKGGIIKPMFYKCDEGIEEPEFELFTGGVEGPNPDYPIEFVDSCSNYLLALDVFDKDKENCVVGEALERVNVMIPTSKFCGIRTRNKFRSNYTDKEGRMWVCDEVNYETGKYIERIYEFNATGLFNPPEEVNGNTEQFTVDVPITPLLGTDTIVCNKLVYKDNQYTDETGFYYLMGKIYVKINGVNDIYSFNNFLGDVVFRFVLYEPVEYDILPEEMNKILSLNTYDKVTTMISSNHNIPPVFSVSYGKTDTVASTLLAENLSRRTSLIQKRVLSNLYVRE